MNVEMWLDHANDFAQMLNEFGSTVSYPNVSAPGTPMAAFQSMVDESIGSLHRMATQAQIDAATGRLAVFFVDPDTYTTLPQGILLQYDGEYWNVSAQKLIKQNDIPICGSLLAQSGAFG